MPDTALTALSACDLVAAMRERRLSASEVMAGFLDRIATVNPRVNAIVTLRPREELLAEAAAMDRAGPQGPLWGLPVAVKDLVATKGMRTTWGSPLFAGHVPAADDLVAARLRAAGAILIGKTNTPEWGHGSHTFNPVFGATRNPYDLARSAGGSSGGAAAALAARMVSLADGSDMMGSLRNPAAFCNVYGFRPTWGLVPQDADGDTYLATLATDGPMARCPSDLALLLSVLAGPNPEAPFGRPAEDYAAGFRGDLRGKRIGWLSAWGGAYPFEPGILQTCDAGLKLVADLAAAEVHVAGVKTGEKDLVKQQAGKQKSGRKALGAAGASGNILDSTGVTGTKKVPAVAKVSNCRKGYVALTFDDGPSVFTPDLVRVLQRLQIPATFFMVGSRVGSNRQVVNMVREGGFGIGSHTWDHANLLSLSPKRAMWELRSTSRALSKAHAGPPVLMRPPYGLTNARIRKQALSLWRTHVIWTEDSKD